MEGITNRFTHVDNALTNAWVSKTFLALLPILIVLPFVTQYTWTNVVTRAMILGLFAISLDIMWGYTGILSFGHAVFFGLGAYTAAYTMNYLTLFGPVVILLAFGVGAIFSVFIMYPPIRAKSSEIFIAVVPIIFSLSFQIFGRSYPNLTGGFSGLNITDWPYVPIPMIGSVEISGGVSYYLYVLIMLVAIFLVLNWFVKSAYGRIFMAIRENEVRARTLGYNTNQYMLISVVIASGLGAVAGALWSPLNGVATPSIFGFILSGEVVLFVLLGGRGTLIGPLLGAAIIFIPRSFVRSTLPGLWVFLTGALFILLVLYFPDGIINRLMSILKTKS